jgi:hypothetical protein
MSVARTSVDRSAPPAHRPGLMHFNFATSALNQKPVSLLGPRDGPRHCRARLQPCRKTGKIYAALQFAEKSFSACHSKRSEESLCAECQEKERFLVAPLLGMTRLGSFSATCLAAEGFVRGSYFFSEPATQDTSCIRSG